MGRRDGCGGSDGGSNYEMGTDAGGRVRPLGKQWVISSVRRTGRLQGNDRHMETTKSETLRSWREQGA